MSPSRDDDFPIPVADCGLVAWPMEKSGFYEPGKCLTCEGLVQADNPVSIPVYVDDLVTPIRDVVMTSLRSLLNRTVAYTNSTSGRGVSQRRSLFS